MIRLRDILIQIRSLKRMAVLLGLDC